MCKRELEETAEANMSRHYASCLNVAYRDLQVVEILLQFRILLCHVLVFALPLVTGCLQGLHLAFVMTSLDIGLAKPEGEQSVEVALVACIDT